MIESDTVGKGCALTQALTGCTDRPEARLYRVLSTVRPPYNGFGYSDIRHTALRNC